MAKVHYEEVTCRTALNRVRGMPFRWSLNPYRGCVHGCHYCFARRYHGFLKLNASQDFSGIVFVRTNVAHALRQQLRRPSWKRETVAVGTATDPYQPAEGRYRLTRQCLAAFLDHHTPISLVTKGTLIVRDVDLLRALAEGPGCAVCFSLTTLDRDLWQRLEPGTPAPEKRLWALERLSAAGVRAGVLLSPILPGLTDDENSLEAIVRAAADHGAHFLGAQVLHLRSGTREHFLAFLECEYPHLLAAYRRLYPGPYAPKRFQAQVQATLKELKEAYDLRDRPAKKRGSLQQLALPL